LAYQLFNACYGTLVDAVAVIGQSQGGGDYGQLRLYAALGWGVSALSIGTLVDWCGINSIFWSFAVGMMIATVVILAYFSDPPRDGSDPASTGAADRGEGAYAPLSGDDAESRQTNGRSQSEEDKINRMLGDGRESHGLPNSAKQSLYDILTEPQVLLLFINLFIQGVLIAFVESFLFVYIVDEYDAPNYFLGLCVLQATLFECPVFYYSQSILSRFGVIGVLTMAQYLYAFRVWAYTYVPSGKLFGSALDGWWLFLALEPFHALVFAGMWSAAVEYARTIAPVEHQGTVQALVRGCYYLVGIGVGSQLGGYLIEHYSYRFMYRVGGVAMVIWSCIWHASMAIAKRACNKARDRGSNPYHSSVDGVPTKTDPFEKIDNDQGDIYVSFGANTPRDAPSEGAAEVATDQTYVSLGSRSPAKSRFI